MDVVDKEQLTRELLEVRMYRQTFKSIFHKKNRETWGILKGI